MAKTLEAHDKLIREMIEGSYRFEIPDYQRPYAWKLPTHSARIGQYRFFDEIF